MKLYGDVGQFNNTAEPWVVYEERLQQFFIANEIAVEKQVAVLLTVVGQRTYQLLRDLAQPKKPSELTYAEINVLLEGHFSPKPLVIAERFKFYKRCQQPGESVLDFNASLRRLAEHCEFGTVLQDALRDMLVCGLKTESVQRRLLAEPKLTYDRALKLALAHESAEKGVKVMHNSSTSTTVSEGSFSSNAKTVNAVQARCFRCHGAHYADSCRFISSKCFTCGEIGHVKIACRKSSKKSDTAHGKSNKNTFVDSKGKRKYSKPRHQIKMVHYESNCEYDNDTASSLDLYQVSDEPITPALTVNILLNDRPIEFIVDTAAPVTIISEETLHGNFNGVKLTKSRIKLSSYSGDKIPVVGEFKCNVKYGNQNEILPVVVVSGARSSLLGRNWLRTIKLNWTQIFAVGLTENRPISDMHVFDKFKPVFTPSLPADKIKGFKADIRVKEGAEPVFIKSRHIPYAQIDKVNDELKRLEESGIIKKVNYSPWASAVVVVSKSDKSVRLCGDYKQTVNKVV